MMDICLIMDNPETPHHPVIAVALQELSTRHSVRLLDVRTLNGEQAVQEEARHPQADLYLLKSHAPQALEVAHALEEKGALVVNSWASSVACQDRVLMAQRMHEAHLPWPNMALRDAGRFAGRSGLSGDAGLSCHHQKLLQSSRRPGRLCAQL